MGKKEFLDWLLSVEPGLEKWGLEILNNDPGVYLIETEDQNCYGEALKKHYNQIFEEELGNYVSVEKWPKNRSYELFNEWFSLKYHTCISDMLE